MRIIFEFVGGYLDGMCLYGNDWDQDTERHTASSYYWLTDNGRIGARFQSATDYALSIRHEFGLNNFQLAGCQTQVYEVTDKLEGEDEVLVRAKYVMPPDPYAP